MNKKNVADLMKLQSEQAKNLGHLRWMDGVVFGLTMMAYTHPRVHGWYTLAVFLTFMVAEFVFVMLTRRAWARFFDSSAALDRSLVEIGRDGETP